MRTETLRMIPVAAIVLLAQARSVPGEVFLHPTENLSRSERPSEINQVSPQAVATRSGEVTVVWSEVDTDSNLPELAVRQRTAGGWDSEPHRLTENDGLYSGDAAVAVGPAGDVHLAWIDQRGGTMEVWSARLVDGRLADAQALSSGADLVLDPAIAVGADGEVYVAWTAMRRFVYELYWRVWTRSAGWSEVEQISPAGGPESSQAALAVGSDGGVHLVWTDRLHGPRNVYHRVRRAGTWSEPMAVAVLADGETAVRPGLALDVQERAHIVWQLQAGQQFFAMYARIAADGGLVGPVVIAGYETVARSPAIGIDSAGVAHIVWEDGRSASLAERAALYVAYVQLADGELGEARLVSDPDSGPYMAPAIAVDADGSVHIVWHANERGSGDILYRQAGLVFAPGAGGGR